MAQVLSGQSLATKPATPEIQKICNEVKSQAEQKTNKKYAEFRAVEYCQMEGGPMYLIKVHAGINSYLHLHVWQTRPYAGGTVVLTQVQEHQSKYSPLYPL